VSEHLTSEVPVVRAVRATPVFRDAASADGGVADSLGVLEIRFSPFGTWYEVHSWWEGDFLERTVGGAYVQTIAEDRDQMRCLYDHGFDPQIGNKVLGPIDDLREDPDTPVGVVPLFDTAYNRDLLPGLKAGVYGSSMRMRVVEEAWNDEPDPSSYNPKGLPERTISRVKVMEFGPVTFPANPDASAGMRSLTDTFYDRLKQRDTGAYEDAVRAAGRTPDLTRRPVARSAGGGDRNAGRPADGQPILSHRQRLDDGALRARGIMK
jgi:HK97 family phage prohead protease